MDQSIKFNLSAYRYRSVQLNIRAINDFLRGLRWLAKIDTEVLHQEVSSLAHKFIPVDEMPIPLSVNKYNRSKERFKEKRLMRLIRKITLNGHLLPSRRTAFTRGHIQYPGLFYRARRVFTYDESTQRAFVTRRSLVRSFILLCAYLKTRLLFTIRFNTLRHEMKEDFEKVTSMATWERIVG
jgi:hypothetical protein